MKRNNNRSDELEPFSVSGAIEYFDSIEIAEFDGDQPARIIVERGEYRFDIVPTDETNSDGQALYRLRHLTGSTPGPHEVGIPETLTYQLLEAQTGIGQLAIAEQHSSTVSNRFVDGPTIFSRIATALGKIGDSIRRA